MKNNQNQFFNNYLPENNYPLNADVVNSQPSELSKSSVGDKSAQSNNEKDLEIRFLKKELEFYKSRCEAL